MSKTNSAKQEAIKRRNYLLGLMEDANFVKYVANPIIRLRQKHMGTLRNLEATEREMRQAQVSLDAFDYFDGIFDKAERIYQAQKEKELKNERSSGRSNGARLDYNNIRVVGPAGSGSIG